MNDMAKQHLLRRMRSKTTKNGNVYYYYDTCAKPRKWLPLGANYLEALKKFAEYEKEYNAESLAKSMRDATTFKFVANRYLQEVIPAKAPRTQKDNLAELGWLLKFFDNPPAPIDSIKPVHIREYLDWRKDAPRRANAEKSLFSHIFNKAREWGYTEQENPCTGVKGYKKSHRDVYVTDNVFWEVYQHAEEHIQYMMIVAYLTGQRVADVLKIQISDFVGDELWIVQNKTQTKVRIQIIGLLKEVIEAIVAYRQSATHNNLFTKNGDVVTYYMLRAGFDRARTRAGIEKTSFQFRDLRAKAATDKDDTIGIEAARTLLGHATQSMTSDYIRNRKGRLVAPLEGALKVGLKAENLKDVEQQ